MNKVRGLIMGDLYNNKLCIEESMEDVYEQKEDTERLIINDENEKLRLENQNKFDSIKSLLKQNMEFQDLINLVMVKTQFDYVKLKKKMKGVTIFFICLCILAIALGSYYAIKIKPYLLIKFLSLFVLIIILFLITRKIVRRRTYKIHVKNCNKLELNFKDLVLSVRGLLDNYGKLSGEIPVELAKCISKKHRICNYDKYFTFICENNKNIRKEIKNKKLKIFKGIFCKNKYMLSIIESAENNYFNTVFVYNRRDSFEEAIKSYLKDQE